LGQQLHPAERFLRFVYADCGDYEIVGQRLFCDDDDVILSYVARITDVSKFDALFEDVLVLRLALALVMPLAQDKNLRESIAVECARANAHARTVNLQTGGWTTVQTWNEARTGTDVVTELEPYGQSSDNLHEQRRGDAAHRRAVRPVQVSGVLSHAGEHAALVYGPVERRPGTEYIASAKSATTAARLVGFIYSADIAYMVEFGEYYARFYYDGEPLLDGTGAVLEIVTPYAAADLPALQTRQLGDVMWIVHPDYAPRKLSRTTATTFTLAEIDYHNGPFLTRNDLNGATGVTMTSSVTAKDAVGTLTASAAFFQAGHVGSLFMLVQTGPTPP